MQNIGVHGLSHLSLLSNGRISHGVASSRRLKSWTAPRTRSDDKGRDRCCYCLDSTIKAPRLQCN